MRRLLRRLGCLPLAVIVIAVMILAAAILLWPATLPESEPLVDTQSRKAGEPLRSVASFATIADPRQRSVALFREAGRVIQHPRCQNCHPRGDTPTQTSALRQHIPAVTRGTDNGGSAQLRCTTCHHEANFAASGVPGNPRWRLAPREMAWQGKSLGDICRQLLDPARSHMTRAELLAHMTQDSLVGWAWHPGGDRAPAPGTQAQFGSLIAAWLDTGAQCPV